MRFKVLLLPAKIPARCLDSVCNSVLFFSF